MVVGGRGASRVKKQLLQKGLKCLKMHLLSMVSFCSSFISQLLSFSACFWNEVLLNGRVWHGLVMVSMSCYGLERVGKVWYSFLRFGIVWYRLFWVGMNWYVLVWFVMGWKVSVWVGMGRYGLVRDGMSRYGLVCAPHHYHHHHPLNYPHHIFTINLIRTSPSSSQLTSSSTLM